MFADGQGNLGQHLERSGNAVELPSTVVRDDDGHCALIHGPPGVVTGHHSLDDDRTSPGFADPAQVFPDDGRLGQGRADIEQLHRPASRNDDVLQPGQAPVQQEARQPTGAGEQLREKRKPGRQAAGQELAHAVAVVALAHPGHGGVDRDDQGREAGGAGPLDRGEGGGAAADEVELVPDGTGRGRPDGFQAVPGDRRKDVRRAGRSGRPCRRHFPARVHEPAEADGSEQRGEREVVAQHPSPHIAVADRNGVTGPEGHLLEGAAVRPQRDLAFRAAVQVVEDDPRHPAAGERPEIFGVDDGCAELGSPEPGFYGAFFGPAFWLGMKSSRTARRKRVGESMPWARMKSLNFWRSKRDPSMRSASARSSIRRW